MSYSYSSESFNHFVSVLANVKILDHTVYKIQISITEIQSVWARGVMESAQRLTRAENIQIVSVTGIERFEPQTWMPSWTDRPPRHVTRILQLFEKATIDGETCLKK